MKPPTVLSSNNKSSIAKNYLWLNLYELPYFRALIRSVEVGFYQNYDLPPRTLDLGCGDGHFAHVAFDRSLDVGLDPDGKDIHLAARRGSYKLLVQADGCKMSFPSGYFASAISNSVLEHIDHIDAVLMETARVMRSGSLFLFCVPNPRYLTELSVPRILNKIGLKGLAETYTQWFQRMSYVHHLDWPDVWQTRLERAGFVLEDWWHYFSPHAMQTLEIGHYLGLPCLIIHWMTGRWILVPKKWNLALTERLVRSHVTSSAHQQGTFTFYVARRK
jgi:SAM-dependent methyltransferase